jgi:geranylgeranyl diphosphate synthase type II
VTVEEQLRTYALEVDARLDALLPSEQQLPHELAAAMRYACLGPGKRLRPALCLASCEAVEGDRVQAMDASCALEMVHSFSLIHDDLPALDNDDLRRGRPTCHVAFGEAIAILAGDGLFSLAFETLAALGGSVRCVQILSNATGLGGLVAGEAADIVSEGKPVDLELLEFIHRKKTGSLVRAACEIGAVLGGGDDQSIRSLREYGECVGLAFQIADDILDETSTREQLGKSAGADRQRQKATYPRLMGIEASRARAAELSAAAVARLEDLPGPVEFLTQLAQFAVHRTK